VARSPDRGPPRGATEGLHVSAFTTQLARAVRQQVEFSGRRVAQGKPVGTEGWVARSGDRAATAGRSGPWMGGRSGDRAATGLESAPGHRDRFKGRRAGSRAFCVVASLRHATLLNLPTSRPRMFFRAVGSAQDRQCRFAARLDSGVMRFRRALGLDDGTCSTEFCPRGRA
jgi:hypothetical protein